jgi:hypothetical protein
MIVSKDLIIKSFDTGFQLCLIITGLDNQAQKLNYQINQYPKKNLIIVVCLAPYLFLCIYHLPRRHMMSIFLSRAFARRRRNNGGRGGRNRISPSGPFNVACCISQPHSVLASPARIPTKIPRSFTRSAVETNSPFAHAFGRRKLHHAHPLWAPSPQYVGTKRHKHHQLSLQLPSAVLPLLPRHHYR